MGWLTVLLYLLTALNCGLVAHNLIKAEANSTTESRIWITLALMFLALGINKQLDLRLALTQFGREPALTQGWYEHRRTEQLIFIAIVAFVQ